MNKKIKQKCVSSVTVRINLLPSSEPRAKRMPGMMVLKPLPESIQKP
jgi:hypothetical protein